MRYRPRSTLSIHTAGLNPAFPLNYGRSLCLPDTARFGGATVSEPGRGNIFSVNSGTWVSSPYGPALSFAGTGQGVETASSLDYAPGMGAYTIAALFKGGNASQFGVIAARYATATNQTCICQGAFSSGATGQYISVGAYDGVSIRSMKTTGTVDNGQWHHVAGVNTGAAITIFVDGQAAAIANDSVSGNPNLAGAGHFAVGARGAGGNPYTGQIRMASYWPRALTAAEIAIAYSEAVSGLPNTLVFDRPAPMFATSSGIHFHGLSLMGCGS